MPLECSPASAEKKEHGSATPDQGIILEHLGRIPENPALRALHLLSLWALNTPKDLSLSLCAEIPQTFVGPLATSLQGCSWCRKEEQNTASPSSETKKSVHSYFPFSNQHSEASRNLYLTNSRCMVFTSHSGKYILIISAILIPSEF